MTHIFGKRHKVNLPAPEQKATDRARHDAVPTHTRSPGLRLVSSMAVIVSVLADPPFARRRFPSATIERGKAHAVFGHGFSSGRVFSHALQSRLVESAPGAVGGHAIPDRSRLAVVW